MRAVGPTHFVEVVVRRRFVGEHCGGITRNATWPSFPLGASVDESPGEIASFPIGASLVLASHARTVLEPVEIHEQRAAESRGDSTCDRHDSIPHAHLRFNLQHRAEAPRTRVVLSMLCLACDPGAHRCCDAHRHFARPRMRRGRLARERRKRTMHARLRLRVGFGLRTRRLRSTADSSAILRSTYNRRRINARCGRRRRNRERWVRPSR